eukprot:TRINITY_DN9142_c0_g1_i1.p1 TRINITY_DN9142_c0_g1~~TRINITY_DN9142_c0_g1_i1.p1  ORF type:complete len:310 (-),score=79.85 TRINITY_DN9142_c0_g1_i1:22-951(-)
MVIDSQDLHCLRHHRERAVANGASMREVIDVIPQIDDHETLREISSFHRADHVLVVSDHEEKLLKDHFHLHDRVSISSFYYGQPPIIPDGRKNGFVMIGNYRHPPNRDQIKWMYDEIWPKIRSEIPDAKMTVAGVYADMGSLGMNDPKIGFQVRDSVPDIHTFLRKFRVHLAPLRFGAGIKGKIADSWYAGIPTVTTPIGSEGMHSGNFGGKVADNADDFARHAIDLHRDTDLWKRTQESGFQNLRDKFPYDDNAENLISTLKRVVETKDASRRSNVIGEMLWFHQNRSMEYMSRFIELKNKTPKTPSL